MRLRYLRVQGRPPLEDVSARFGFEPVLPRECAVHFVVGVNGTGKTRLLQALAQTFVSLGNGDLPPFPVAVAYDLGIGDAKRTLVFTHFGNRGDARLIEITPALPEPFVDWDALAGGEYVPTSEFKQTALLRDDALRGGISPLYLPNQLLMFTTGTQTVWEEIVKPSHGESSIPLDELIEGSFRSPDWTIADEAKRQRDDFLQNSPLRQKEDLPEPKEAAPLEGNTETRLGELITLDLLPLAFLSVELAEHAKGSKSESAQESSTPSTSSWQRILSAVGEPVSVTLVLRFDQSFVKENADPTLRQLQSIRTDERPEPMTNSSRWTELIFDLDDAISDASNDSKVVVALVEALAGSTPSRFGVYRRLRDWWNTRALLKATLAIRKRGELMLFDSLSDGERSFLGRMALLHILADQDDVLLILDEPETHFNDVWKRQIVDILDDNIRERTNEVVIATHTSIALTDVFRSELIVLTQGRAKTPNIETFGASPNEILVNLFGAEVNESVDPLGQRAAEFLDIILMVVSRPAQALSIWAQLRDGASPASVQSSQSFTALRDFVRTLPHQLGDDDELNDRLLKTMVAVQDYARIELNKRDLTIEDVLSVLAEKLGPGAYEFEFRRRLSGLRANINASQNRAS